MNKIVYLSAITFLSLINIAAYATIRFDLTNKSSQPIWLSGEANDLSFTGSGDCYSYKRKLAPEESFTINIPNGMVKLTITPINPCGKVKWTQQFRTYTTSQSANNKDKILVWNHTGHPKEPLYPASSHTMGLIKTKLPNNIDIKELQMTGQSGL